jgi:L-fucose isomerase
MAMLRRKNEVSGPVVGVSAVIDGREEAMKRQEARVRKVARMVAELVDKEFPHIDGKPAHVVLADELVKDAASACRVGRQFRHEGVEVLLSYDDVWAYPGELEGLLLQNISMGQIPVAHVSGNSATWPGVVYACAATGMLAQWGYLVHRIVGDVTEKGGLAMDFTAELKADLLDWLAAATTFADMWGTPYASFGGHSMNMETGLAHVIPARRYFGINTIHIDMMELRGRIEAGRYEAESKELLRWLQKMMPGRIHQESVHGDREDNLDRLQYQCQMYLAMKEIMAELGATVGGFQGQRQWTDYLPTGDVPEAILNDNFDHTGRKLPLAFATENDFNRGLTQRLCLGLSRGLPAIFMDFRKAYLPTDPLLVKHASARDRKVIDAGGGVVDFCNSGNHPPFYAGLDEEDPARNYAHVNLWPVIQSYFPGGGFSVEFNAAACDMLFSGLALRPDNTFVLQASMGRSVTLSRALSQAINGASDPTWPHLYGVFADDLKTVLDTWHSNHAVGMVAREPERARRRIQYWADIARVPLIAYDSVTAGGRTLPLQYQMFGGQVAGAGALGPRG